MIPWRLFWLLYRQIPRVAAAHRLNQIEAISTGIANSVATKPEQQAAVARRIKALRAEAEGTD